MQVDILSDASLSTSSLSRTSSATGEAATSPAPRAEQRQQQSDGGEAVSGRSPRPGPSEPAPVPMSRRHSGGPSTALSGSLQYTVESLHAIVETLPGPQRHHVSLERLCCPE